MRHFRGESIAQQLTTALSNSSWTSPFHVNMSISGAETPADAAVKQRIAADASCGLNAIRLVLTTCFHFASSKKNQTHISSDGFPLTPTGDKHKYYQANENRVTQMCIGPTTTSMKSGRSSSQKGPDVVFPCPPPFSPLRRGFQCFYRNQRKPNQKS